MTDICIISGRYPATPFASAVNHRAYAARHGYAYIHCNWPTGAENRYFNKLAYLRHYAHRFEYVFWIDDDAFFIDLDASLDRFLPGRDEFLSICSSPTDLALHTVISSGQFLLRSDDRGLAFLAAVAEVDLQQVRAWWRPELGYFSNGDQDAMVYLLGTNPQFEGGVRRFPSTAFNSRITDVLAGREVFILHLTGSTVTKLDSLDAARRALGRGPSLLDPAEDARWNVVPGGRPGGRAQRIARRVVRHRRVRRLAGWVAKWLR